MTVVTLPVGDDRCPGATAEFEIDPDDEPSTGLLARRRADPGGTGSTGRIDGTGTTLAASLDRALPALSLILAKVRAAAADADEITLDMGLRVGGETGLVFVKGSADASIAVSITWRRDDDGHGR